VTLRRRRARAAGLVATVLALGLAALVGVLDRPSVALAGAPAQVGTGPTATVPPGPVYPERLLLTADEWDLTVSRAKLRPGPAIVELYNRGEDPHDVRVKRRGSKGFVAIPETAPGGLTRIQTGFRPGSRYRLWCSLEGHREQGMEAELRTSKAG
jgi:hypothetical protein